MGPKGGQAPSPLSLALEYLECEGFAEAARTLEKEAQAANIKYTKLEAAYAAPALTVDAILGAFDNCDLHAFSLAWNKSIPKALRGSDETCIKLEFYANLYFAVCGIHPHIANKPQGYSREKAMGILKKYLDKTAQSSNTPPELLAFFALPYIPDPVNHASFKHIFTDSWVGETRARLEAFLNEVVRSKTTHLEKIVTEWEVATSEGKMAKGVEGIRRELDHVTTERNELWRRHQQLQREYFNLLGITDELVDAVLTGIQGTPISHALLADLCTRLNSFTGELQLSQFDSPRDGQGKSTGSGSAVRSSGQDSHQSTAEGVVEDIVIESPLPELNFMQLQHTLATTATPEEKGFILQALRWRITQVPPGERRRAILNAYIEHDLFEVAGNSPDGIVSMALDSADPVLQELAARLMNVVASLSQGRKYFCDAAVITKVFEFVEEETARLAASAGDTDVGVKRHGRGARDSEANANVSIDADGIESRGFQFLVAFLQHLSLKRRNQSILIDCGVVSWLVQLFSCEKFSSFTVQYASALFMNVCLRAKGKTQCLENTDKILSLLTDLLDNDNDEVKTYANACFYSLFTRKAIRDTAIEMGLADELTAQMDACGDAIAEQLAHVIDQLSITTDDSDDVDRDDAIPDDDDDSQIEIEMMENDLQEDEPLYGTKANSGESALRAVYADCDEVYLGKVPVYTVNRLTTRYRESAELTTNEASAERSSNGQLQQNSVTAEPESRTAPKSSSTNATDDEAIAQPQRPKSRPLPALQKRAANATSSDDERSADAGESHEGGDQQQQQLERPSSRIHPSRPVSSRSRTASRPGSSTAPQNTKMAVDGLRKSTAKLSQALSAMKQKEDAERGEASNGADEGDVDDAKTPVPPPVEIDKSASNLLGKDVAKASDKPTAPRNAQEGENLDEYYAVFATRSKLMRD